MVRTRISKKRKITLGKLIAWAQANPPRTEYDRQCLELIVLRFGRNDRGPIDLWLLQKLTGWYEASESVRVYVRLPQLTVSATKSKGSK